MGSPGDPGAAGEPGAPSLPGAPATVTSYEAPGGTPGQAGKNFSLFSNVFQVFIMDADTLRTAK